MSHIILNHDSLTGSSKLFEATYIGNTLTVKNFTVFNTTLSTTNLITFNATEFILDEFTVENTKIGSYSLIKMTQVNDFTLTNIDIINSTLLSTETEKYAFEIQRLMSYNSTFDNAGTISAVKISSSGLSLACITNFENTATQLYKFSVIDLTSTNNIYAHP